MKRAGPSGSMEPEDQPVKASKKRKAPSDAAKVWARLLPRIQAITVVTRIIVAARIIVATRIVMVTRIVGSFVQRASCCMHFVLFFLFDPHVSSPKGPCQSMVLGSWSGITSMVIKIEHGSLFLDSEAPFLAAWVFCACGRHEAIFHTIARVCRILKAALQSALCPNNALSTYLQADSAGPSSAAALPPRTKPQEQEEDSEPEGSEVSYDSDEPQECEESDADSDAGECALPQSRCFQQRSVFGIETIKPACCCVVAAQLLQVADLSSARCSFSADLIRSNLHQVWCCDVLLLLCQCAQHVVVHM